MCVFVYIYIYMYMYKHIYRLMEWNATGWDGMRRDGME